eukprot:Nk52_evm6s151 gene=Nk52_evmTU6s151
MGWRDTIAEREICGGVIFLSSYIIPLLVVSLVSVLQCTASNSLLTAERECLDRGWFLLPTPPSPPFLTLPDFARTVHESYRYLQQTEDSKDYSQGNSPSANFYTSDHISASSMEPSFSNLEAHNPGLMGTQKDNTRLGCDSSTSSTNKGTCPSSLPYLKEGELVCLPFPKLRCSDEDIVYYLHKEAGNTLVEKVRAAAAFLCDEDSSISQDNANDVGVKYRHKLPTGSNEEKFMNTKGISDFLQMLQCDKLLVNYTEVTSRLIEKGFLQGILKDRNTGSILSESLHSSTNTYPYICIPFCERSVTRGGSIQQVQLPADITAKSAMDTMQYHSLLPIMVDSHTPLTNVKQMADNFSLITKLKGAVWLTCVRACPIPIPPSKASFNDIAYDAQPLVLRRSQDRSCANIRQRGYINHRVVSDSSSSFDISELMSTTYMTDPLYLFNPLGGCSGVSTKGPSKSDPLKSSSTQTTQMNRLVEKYSYRKSDDSASNVEAHVRNMAPVSSLSAQISPLVCVPLFQQSETSPTRVIASPCFSTSPDNLCLSHSEFYVDLKIFTDWRDVYTRNQNEFRRETEELNLFLTSPSSITGDVQTGSYLKREIHVLYTTDLSDPRFSSTASEMDIQRMNMPQIRILNNQNSKVIVRMVTRIRTYRHYKDVRVAHGSFNRYPHIQVTFYAMSSFTIVFSPSLLRLNSGRFSAIGQHYHPRTNRHLWERDSTIEEMLYQFTNNLCSQFHQNKQAMIVRLLVYRMQSVFNPEGYDESELWSTTPIGDYWTCLMMESFINHGLISGSDGALTGAKTQGLMAASEILKVMSFSNSKTASKKRRAWMVGSNNDKSQLVGVLGFLVLTMLWTKGFSHLEMQCKENSISCEKQFKTIKLYKVGDMFPSDIFKNVNRQIYSPRGFIPIVGANHYYLLDKNIQRISGRSYKGTADFNIDTMRFLEDPSLLSSSHRMLVSASVWTYMSLEIESGNSLFKNMASNPSLQDNPCNAINKVYDIVQKGDFQKLFAQTSEKSKKLVQAQCELIFG